MVKYRCIRQKYWCVLPTTSVEKLLRRQIYTYMTSAPIFMLHNDVRFSDKFRAVHAYLPDPPAIVRIIRVSNFARVDAAAHVVSLPHDDTTAGGRRFVLVVGNLFIEVRILFIDTRAWSGEYLMEKKLAKPEIGENKKNDNLPMKNCAETNVFFFLPEIGNSIVSASHHSIPVIWNALSPVGGGRKGKKGKVS